MSTATPILLERDNVNDDTVILSQWFIPNGGRVEEGSPIAEVETSKANIEVTAPHAGFLEWGVAEKCDIAYSAPIGHIHASAEFVALHASGSTAAAVPEPPADKPEGDIASPPEESLIERAESYAPAAVFPEAKYSQRFSRRAAELIRSNNLSESLFDGLAMVSAKDVLRLLKTGSLDAAPAIPAATPAAASAPARQNDAAKPPTQSSTTVPLSRMKRSEIQALAAGTRNAIPSAVTVACPTRGLRLALQENPVIAGNAGAVIVYETARLLRKYPFFNATYHAGSMELYEQVNIGYAMDDGRGLKVAVMQNCDTKGLGEIAEELRSLVLDYLDNKLVPAQITGGTFTISDLSGFGVASFQPLISEHQGAILGVGGEQFLPGMQHGSFSLTLTFDHQLGEGRTAALFLNDLKDRLSYYEQAMSQRQDQAVACARCGRTAAELPDAKSYMVQTVVPPGHLCNLCMAGL
jgi:pyruvate/2-oxoglutarate dehydrogenase complex dihydrolipoamide acyltransferase (E2) component